MGSSVNGMVEGEFPSSCPPEKLIQDFYSLMIRQMPIDLIVLWTYSKADGQLYLYAFLTDQGLLLRADRMSFTKTGAAEFNGILPEKYHFFADSRNSPGIQEIMEEFPVPQPFTAITVHSHIRDGLYSMASLCASGANSLGKKDLDFIEQNYDGVVLNLRYILSAVEMEMLRKHVSNERASLLKRLGYVGNVSVIGEESGLKETLTLVKRVASLNTTVLITGETGVGKEVIANAIHRSSKRASKPLVSVNCGAIPESLLDSELFGHEKGAFTDAHQAKQGYFEQADGGTIFLDEVGELSFSAQVRLLRLLQTKKYQRVGGTKQISVDVRVIAATNRDLQQMVRNNLFRSDLWFRINTFPILVPPLRERKGDIPALATYFSRMKGREMSLPWVGSFAEGAMAQLSAYSWPGNVRELQSVIERSLILSQGRPMSFPNLQQEACQPLAEGEGVERENDEVNCSLGFATLNEVMTRHIKSALTLTKGRVEGVGGAAKLLDINPSTLRARMKKLGINFSRVIE